MGWRMLGCVCLLVLLLVGVVEASSEATSSEVLLHATDRLRAALSVHTSDCLVRMRYAGPRDQYPCCAGKKCPLFKGRCCPDSDTCCPHHSRCVRRRGVMHCKLSRRDRHHRREEDDDNDEREHELDEQEQRRRRRQRHRHHKGKHHDPNHPHHRHPSMRYPFGNGFNPLGMCNCPVAPRCCQQGSSGFPAPVRPRCCPPLSPCQCAMPPEPPMQRQTNQLVQEVRNAVKSMLGQPVVQAAIDADTASPVPCTCPPPPPCTPTLCPPVPRCACELLSNPAAFDSLVTTPPTPEQITEEAVNNAEATLNILGAQKQLTPGSVVDVDVYVDTKGNTVGAPPNGTVRPLRAKKDPVVEEQRAALRRLKKANDIANLRASVEEANKQNGRDSR